jgi:hypothetical protein
MEPRNAAISVGDTTCGSVLSDSTDFVKFECNAPEFLKLFPNGSFDTMYLDRDVLSQEQQDVIDLAEEMVRRFLKKGTISN